MLLLKFRPLLPALKFCSEPALCSRSCASDPPSQPLKTHAATSAKVKFRTALIKLKSFIKLKFLVRPSEIKFNPPCTEIKFCPLPILIKFCPTYAEVKFRAPPAETEFRSRPKPGSPLARIKFCAKSRPHPFEIRLFKIRSFKFHPSQARLEAARKTDRF